MPQVWRGHPPHPHAVVGAAAQVAATFPVFHPHLSKVRMEGDGGAPVLPEPMEKVTSGRVSRRSYRKPPSTMAW